MTTEIVSYIGSRLAKGFNGSEQSTTWSQVLEVSPALGNPVGEIRDGDDLANVPRNIALRTVYFPNDPGGPVIRWGNSASMKTVLGGGNHDHFWRSGDNTSGGKQGYLTIDSNGNLTVK